MNIFFSVLEFRNIFCATDHNYIYISKIKRITVGYLKRIFPLSLVLEITLFILAASGIKTK